MSKKSSVVTVRLSPEEQQILASIEVTDATTISDKIRRLVQDAGRRRSAQADYSAALGLAQDWVGHTTNNVILKEREQGVHSQFLERFGSWLPVALSTYISHAEGIVQAAESNDTAMLQGLEDDLVDQSFRLVETLLQMGLLEDRGCYSTEAFDRNLSNSLSLAVALQERKAASMKGV